MSRVALAYRAKKKPGSEPDRASWDNSHALAPMRDGKRRRIVSTRTARFSYYPLRPIGLPNASASRQASLIAAGCRTQCTASR